MGTCVCLVHLCQNKIFKIRTASGYFPLLSMYLFLKMAYFFPFFFWFVSILPWETKSQAIIHVESTNTWKSNNIPENACNAIENKR